MNEMKESTQSVHFGHAPVQRAQETDTSSLCHREPSPCSNWAWAIPDSSYDWMDSYTFY
jgi:hypothetical protein